jgi:hypothetical protein
MEKEKEKERVGPIDDEDDDRQQTKQQTDCRQQNERELYLSMTKMTQSVLV